MGGEKERTKEREIEKGEAKERKQERITEREIEKGGGKRKGAKKKKDL
jgi:hypothetical protein